jgi:hypothetical protein
MTTHKYNHPLAKTLFALKPKNQQWAFTLGQTVYYRLPDTGNEILKNHEEIHAMQYRQMGTAKFLYQYFIKEALVPYRKKSLEREAYDNQEDLNYIRGREQNDQDHAA